MNSHSDDKPVCLIIGASRGIGRQIAVDLAREGYYVVVSAKTTSDASAVLASQFPPDPNSSLSTINTVVREIHEAGHSALAIPCDVRSEGSIKALVDGTVAKLGRLDVLIYNAGAIWWSSVANTPLSRFRLLQQVNPQGLYTAIHTSLPHFSSAPHPNSGRIIVVSPPIYSRFFRGKPAYAMGKVAMSVLTKGLAMDFTRQGLSEMSITSIWPACAIESAATEFHSPSLTDDGAKETKLDLRRPTIFSDAILAMLRAPAQKVNGLLDTDEDFLRRECNITDFDKYSVVPGATPRRIMPVRFPVLEVEEQEDEGRRVDSVVLRGERGKL